MDRIVIRRAIKTKQIIYVAKSKGCKQKVFQTDDMEIRYDCAKCYHILCMVYFFDYDLCLALSIFYLYAIFILQKLGK